MTTNKVLLRQLKKSKITDLNNIDKVQIEKLLGFIESSYEEMDGNTYRLERALKVSSEELRDFNDTLEEKVKIEVLKNREKEKRLIEQSRFASLGEMLANIAHQWRQPLSAISSTASGMQLQMELNIANNKEIIESYVEIVKYVNFLTQTIEDFRGFFNEDKDNTDFNILDMIKQTLAIISASYKNTNLVVICNFEDNLKLISTGIPTELSQVFLNILNNAKDATISNKIEKKFVHISYELKDGYNNVYIQDNAGGIPQKIIHKIFDPYFTTKHQSQGTGIGLYMSKDIIEKHFRGFLTVENKKTILDNQDYNGACFKISIPVKR